MEGKSRRLRWRNASDCFSGLTGASFMPMEEKRYKPTGTRAGTAVAAKGMAVEQVKARQKPNERVCRALSGTFV